MDLAKIESAVRKMVEEEPELSDSMLLFLEILTAQVRMRDILTRYLSVDELIRCSDRAMSSGSSLFDACGIPKIPQDLWKELVSSILSALASRREDLKEEVRAIRDSLEEGLFDPESLARLSFRGDLNYARGVSLTVGVSEDLPSALGVWIIQPIFMAIGEVLSGKVSFEGWNEGFCPICGSYTRTSFADEEGVHLKCEICTTEWDYAEGKCPFCGSSEVESSELGRGLHALECRGCGGSWNLVEESALGGIPREIYPILLLRF
ncbi:MAG: formate dehydrogenase accessory protein FdhE [Candidatus Korarchaeum sp.]